MLLDSSESSAEVTRQTQHLHNVAGQISTIQHCHVSYSLTYTAVPIFVDNCVLISVNNAQLFRCSTAGCKCNCFGNNTELDIASEIVHKPCNFCLIPNIDNLDVL